MSRGLPLIIRDTRVIDSDNVLLLHPLNTQRGVAILPAVDPAKENSCAQGVVIAQIFALQPGGAAAFSQQAEAVFAGFRASGVREAGVLVTLDAPQ
jgi:hypothetical protein